jgi:hypothetical protein
MSNRIGLGVLLIGGLAAVFTGCTNSSSGLDSIKVTSPATAMTVGGATLQLAATGTFGNGSHPSYGDVTDTVKWSSLPTGIVTISSSGLVTAVSSGQTTITASATAYTGSITTSSVTITVTGGSGSGGTGTGGGTGLISINVLPGNVVVAAVGQTAQYYAYGTYGTAPVTRDITNQVTWYSGLLDVASVESSGTNGEDGGLVTAMGYTGISPIWAELADETGSIIISNSITFTCKDPNDKCEQVTPPSQFVTLTVFNAGENSTTWEISAPGDTNQPLIHCGPGAGQTASGASNSVCTGTYETGSQVTLTSNITGTGFGGWSSGDGFGGIICTPAAGKSLLNSPTCTVTLSGNTSVGAIFY